MIHSRLAVGLAALCAALTLKGDFVTAERLLVSQGAPPLMVWAWEEPEDLRSLPVKRVGVAFLAETVFLGKDVRVAPRRQGIRVPDGVWAEAVVRLQAEPGFPDSESLRDATAKELLRAAGLPNLRGLQVDFDAADSQLPFYADVLRQVRATLPHGMGLSMTALVSWCSVRNGWIRGMPVDRAVPMYFRLGKHVGRWSVREPLCGESVGVSIDEPLAAPKIQRGQRVYIFAPRPWRPEQLAVLSRSGFPQEGIRGW